MRRVFVLALSLTILLPLLAVLLALGAASSQAQCGGGGRSGQRARAFRQICWRFTSRPPAATSSGRRDGRTWPRSTRSRPTSGATSPPPPRRDRLDAVHAPHLGAIPGLRRPRQPGGPPDPYHPWDAIFTAARYLHASGAPDDWPTAIYAYNHAGWYVAQTQQLSQRYAQTADSTSSATDAPQPGCVTPGPTTSGPAAQILPDGLAAVPQDTPAPVQAAIAAGNRIIDTSHSTERNPNMLTQVQDSYDCSGPFHPGGHRRGEDRTGELLEPSLMPR